MKYSIAHSGIAGVIICSILLQACSGSSGSGPAAVPSASAVHKVTKGALDKLLQPAQLQKAGKKRGVHDISTLRYTVDLVIPASPGSVNNLHIAKWVSLSGGYSLPNVGTVNAFSHLALDSSGNVVWEIDTQSSQSLGLMRVSTSSGAYMGAWTNGTLNIAQAAMVADQTYLQAMENDVNWALDGFPSNPGKPGGTPKPKARHGHSTGLTPEAFEKLGLGWVGMLGGSLIIIGCTLAEPCGLVGIGSAVSLGLGGAVTYITGWMMWYENSKPPATVGAISGNTNDPFQGVTFTFDPPSNGSDGTATVFYCDDYGCVLDITDIHTKE